MEENSDTKQAETKDPISLLPDAILIYILSLIPIYLSFGQAIRDPPVSPPRLPIMYHLKHLELNLHGTRKKTLLYYTRLIEACPLLSRFTMQYYVLNYTEEVRDAEVPIDFEHGSLKVVELVGFKGKDSDYELAFLLLKIAASSIEKLIISLHQFMYDGPQDGVRRLKSVTKQLQAKLPTSVVLDVF